MITTGIIDVYHGDADAIRARGLSLTQALTRAKADPIHPVRMVIAKCTEGGDGPNSGTPYVDPAFAEWLDAALAADLVFGSYHVGTDSQDGAGQADFYACTLKAHGIDPTHGLHCLDREPNRPAMSDQHADEFVTAWRAMHERWPWYYRDASDLHGASGALRACPLWVAAYGDYGGNPATPWPWSAWQYQGAGSDANERPHDVEAFPGAFAGIGTVDASVIQCSAADIEAFLDAAGR